MNQSIYAQLFPYKKRRQQENGELEMPAIEQPVAVDEKAASIEASKPLTVESAGPSSQFTPLQMEEVPRTPTFGNIAESAYNDPQAVNNAVLEKEDQDRMAKGLTPKDSYRALQFLREMKENPKNLDKGFWGTFREIAENFMHGMSQAPQGSNVAQTVTMGLTGAGAGLANRGWNEQRRAMRELPEAEARYQQEYKNYLAGREQDLAYSKEARAQETADFDRRLEALNVALKDRDEISEDDAAMLTEQFGIPVAPKKKGEEFQAIMGADGRLISFNKRTGGYTVGQDRFEKPSDIEKEFPEELFGISDDKAIDAAVAGEIPESNAEIRTIRPEWAANAPSSYKTPEGKLDEKKITAAISGGLLDEGAVYQDRDDISWKNKRAKKRMELYAGRDQRKRWRTRFLQSMNQLDLTPDERQTMYKDLMDHIENYDKKRDGMSLDDVVKKWFKRIDDQLNE